MKLGSNRVRRRAVAGNVAPCTGLGDAEEPGQQFHAQDALQGAPFVRGGRDWSRASLIFSRSAARRVASEHGIR